MNYYAGLDVSLEETAICVVDETGRIVKEARAASEPAALATALKQLDLPLERIGLEACSLTAWLHDGLREAGLPAICIETRQANAAMKTMPNKTDRNDARALAQIMRTGWFRQVHVKSRQCRLWRSLLVARRTILNEMRSIENVVRAILREAGLKLGTPGRPAFAARVRELAGDDSLVMQLVEPLLSVLAAMLSALARLTKQVMDLVRKEAVCRRLMSVPGVGPVTALAFRATIDRPDRFKRSRDVGAHLGLTPARYQSGETDIQGKISRCGDELARTALYEADHVGRDQHHDAPAAGRAGTIETPALHLGLCPAVDASVGPVREALINRTVAFAKAEYVCCAQHDDGLCARGDCSFCDLVGALDRDLRGRLLIAAIGEAENLDIAGHGAVECRPIEDVGLGQLDAKPRQVGERRWGPHKTFDTLPEPASRSASWTRIKPVVALRVCNVITDHTITSTVLNDYPVVPSAARNSNHLNHAIRVPRQHKYTPKHKIEYSYAMQASQETPST